MVKTTLSQKPRRLAGATDVRRGGTPAGSGRVGGKVQARPDAKVARPGATGKPASSEVRKPPHRETASRTARAPVVPAGRYHLVFAPTEKQARDYAAENGLEADSWRFVTKQADIECRHPTKIVRHLVPGLSPEQVSLYRDLGERLRVYGVSIP